MPEDFKILDGGYNDCIDYLREEFTKASGDTDDKFKISVTGQDEPLVLTFKRSDQYLVGIHEQEIPEELQHYRKMNTPATFDYFYIERALKIGKLPLLPKDRVNLRSLAFITSEAARFHVFSRNINQLILQKEQPNRAIDFLEAAFIMNQYNDARQAKGLPAGHFSPIDDAMVHIARMQAIERGKPTMEGSTHNKYLQRTDSVQKLLQPKSPDQIRKNLHEIPRQK